MALPALLAPVVSFLLRDVVLKFIVFTSVFALVAFFVPYAIGFLAPYLGTSGLSGAFSALSPGVWWFLDMFNLAYGVPAVISAFVARFLIRRLPVIG